MAGFGEAFVSTSLQVLSEKLASPALGELKKLYCVEDELGRLTGTLERIRAMLRDAGRIQVEERSVQLWLRDLKDAALDAEDVLDEFEYEALKLQAEGGGGGGSSRPTSSVNRSQSLAVNIISSFSSHQPPLRHPMSHKIDEIHKRLGEIGRWGFHLGSVLGQSGFSWEGLKPGEVGWRGQATASLLSEAQVFGRNKEKEEIVQFLLGSEGGEQGEVEPSQPGGFARPDLDRSGDGDGGRLPLEDLPLHAIVGMGGLGKTTVAQLVYNDSRVEKYFQLKMWVHVHKHFDAHRLTVHMLEHVGDPQVGSCCPENLNVLQMVLRAKLEGKRFLLVLDDVWDVNGSTWQQLRAPLMHGRRGSRVIITTRNANASAVMRATRSIQLEQLSFEDSWSLFRKCAAVYDGNERHSTLTAIGKRIVEKLGGVPLAVKTVGGLLDKELEEQEWVNVLESEVWELQQDEGEILPALRLSYQHLPEHLRQCFAYCALFPKDYKFDKFELVQMWMAQGFVQTKGRKRMEDVGSSYFNELCNRCFFQFSSGKYVIHDLLHDLAQLVSKDENLRVQGGRWNSSYGKHLRHLSVCCHQADLPKLESFYKFENLRTLLYSSTYPLGMSNALEKMLVYFKCLRVLDLSQSQIESLPHSVGGLKHLRYLNLNGTNIKELPDSLGSLYHLQTLKLEGCDQLMSLPMSISNLLNLRHLEGKAELIFETTGIAKLVHLQQLQPFYVSKDGGRKVGELKDLNELHGKLTIRNLQDVGSEEEANEARLRDKDFLERLELEWVDKWESIQRNSGLEDAVLESLLPPRYLKNLTIKCYGGVKFPGWIQDNLTPHIHSISLNKCRNLTVIPSLMRLTSLRSLHISDCLELRELGVLPTALIELTVLNAGLIALPGLCEYHGVAAEPGGKQGSNISSSISAIIVSGCPNLVSLRQGLLRHRLSSLKVLRIEDCEELIHWPEEEDFLATSLFLHSFEIYDCPKLKPLPELYTTITPQLKTLIVVNCPSFLDEIFLIHLQNLSSTFIHVKISYTDWTSCIKEALQHMASLRRLNLYYVDDILTSRLTVDESALVSLIFTQNTLSSFPFWSSELYVRDSPPTDAIPTEDRSMLNMYLQDHLSSLCDLQADSPHRTYVPSGEYAFHPHPNPRLPPQSVAKG